MNTYPILWCLVFTILGCQEPAITDRTKSQPERDTITNSVQKSAPLSLATAFDYPVGPPNAKGYYNAQAFGKNQHLGDDWNANTGGNSDLGDPIYAAADGYVKFADDLQGGWGNVIRIDHYLPKVWAKELGYQRIESLYAHCEEMLVKKGEWVKKGQQIGTIGNVNGLYYAHLHFEMRWNPDLSIGPGYSTDTSGYLDPTHFIRNHRSLEQ